MKTNFFFRAFTLFVILISIFSCGVDDFFPHDDDEIDNPVVDTIQNENERLEKVLSSNRVKTNLVIKVKSSERLNLVDATVNILGKTIKTDSFGVAIFENLEVREDYNLLTVEMSGYSKAIKTFTPGPNGLSIIEIYLRPSNDSSLKFNSQEGGTLSQGETILNFPPNAITNQNGDPYSGEVSVEIVNFYLGDDDFALAQPATLIGLDDDDQLFPLISEGMLTVNLTDSNRAPLQIADNMKIKVDMPASATGPQEIGLWHLNETYGLWVQTGIATKNGNRYQFEVNKFSTYNLDYKGSDSIDSINIKVIDANENIFSNQRFLFKNEETSRELYFVTDNLGEAVILRAPQGNYTLYHEGCEGAIVSNTLNITTIGDYKFVMDFDAANMSYLNLNGSIKDCNDKFLSNKYFNIIIDGNLTLDFYSDENGKYSISEFLCEGLSGDLTAQLRYTTQDGTITNNFKINLSNPINPLNVSGCGDIGVFDDETEVLFSSGCLKNFVLYYYENELKQPISDGVVRYKHVKNLMSTIVNDTGCFLGGNCGRFIDTQISEANRYLEDVTFFTNLEQLSLNGSLVENHLESVLEALSKLNSLKVLSIATHDFGVSMEIETIQSRFPDIRIERIGCD